LKTIALSDRVSNVERLLDHVWHARDRRQPGAALHAGEAEWRQQGCPGCGSDASGCDQGAPLNQVVAEQDRRRP
jgi:hypothetical protein